MFKYIKHTTVTDEYTTHSFNELNDKCKLYRFDVPFVSVQYELESDFTELMLSQNANIKAVEITKLEFEEGVKNSAQVTHVYNVANEQFISDMASISTKYTQEEISTWATQVEDARNYLSNATASPLLSALALEDKITLTEAANLLIAKRTDYSGLSAWALGRKWDKVRELKLEVGL